MPPGDETVFAPHSSGCMGCGPDNPAGLRMAVRRDGDDVVTDIVFDERQAGAPGLAHGGAVAAACDDLFGFVLYLARTPAVTKTLQVEYFSPVPLGAAHRIRGRLVERDGRKLHMRAEGSADDGTVRFTATALFVQVPRSHFEAFGTFEDHPGLTRLEAGD
ncbi:PaaI family thioesterase [Pseudonocardia endophytica]|uniref:Acyl-coenzyme A thioesterase THEM4 n=1 Tax=Pseudonocardia endophytica TaxID=401976 RepID=A0A4R1I1S1_PSEEN|nr:PaaI family thioesterase [Pseudonocardia endophytica]TCK27525.1 acyl-coenzyme A thioesterase PaaI-like protein [Pseudonocardia endophytica]